MDVLNAIITSANYLLIPGIAYGSQLVLAATVLFGILRFSKFENKDTGAGVEMLANLEARKSLLGSRGHG